MILLVNLFVLLSVICVLLNLAGFILGCQGAQFVSSLPRCDLADVGESKFCFCCEEFLPEKCTEKDNALKLYPVQPCGAVHLLLKSFFPFCRTTESSFCSLCSECLDHYCMPSSCCPTLSADICHKKILHSKKSPMFMWRKLKNKATLLIQKILCHQYHLPHILLHFTLVRLGSIAVGGDECNSITRETTLHPDASLVPAGTSKTVLKPLRKRSKSDPVLHGFPPRGPVLSCEAATQTELKPELATVTLRKSLRAKALRSRPRSLIDYKSYMDTKLLVARFLEQSSCTMTPDIHELVEDIKCVLKSDEEHMEEAIHSASFLEQVMIPACSSASKAYTLPFRKHPGLLHLESCGDVSTFTTAETRRLEKTQRSEPERPHSLIGVVRETVL
uniref:protein FAM189A2 isoform X4 n=1 Tax=Podarcis muralis TaxID=64176 RepID=UPI0010A094FE|nr:protein FAM189A2 isoform X4 [Podarcis muralis]